MKKFLNDLITRKQNLIKELRSKMDKSEDINEVRSLGDQIRAAQDEIEEARAKLAETNTRLANTRAEMDEGNDEGEQEEGGNDEEKQPEGRSRTFAPGMGKVVGAYDQRSALNQHKQAMESRAQQFAKTGRMGVAVSETRATLISGGKIATPTEVGGINDAFNQVSSIVDMVKVVDCEGMGAYKVAYEIASATAATQTEGADANASDPNFAYVEITPVTEAVVSTISKQVRKQSPLNYTQKVQESALTALRKRAAKIITDKIIASTLVEKLTGVAIDEKTLRKVALNYGGNEAIMGGAVLFLNKTDLIALGDVRGTSDKKPVYEITPDTGNPNTGVIKDGGLSVRYCINSNQTAGTLIYGDPHCCELALFSNYEIAVSEDRNIEKLMLTIVGDVELGCGVTVNKGFVVATAAAS